MSPSRLRPVKRLMLIFPPMFNTRQIDTMVCPPMGIASLAAYVRDLVEVRLLDCLAEDGDRREPVSQSIDRVGMSYARIIDEIRTWAPDMVGLSCIFSSQWSAVAELTERIKQDVDSDMVVVTGGTHPSFLPESTLARSRVDYVVLGEGERGLRDLIMAHNRGGGLDRIDGIAYRDNGSIVVRPRTSWIEDLDSLPFPARDLLPMEKYFATRVPMGLHWRKVRNTPIVSSRGCPLKCPFCSSWRHWGARFRKRSAGNVLAEIAHLRDVYDVRELKWQDDNLTTDRSRARAIFTGMIERGLVMPWNTPNGIALWTLDEELVRLMKQSGCYELTLAVESGDPASFAAYIRKPFTLARAKDVADMCRRHGIATVAYFIIGFPGESLAQIENSMRFARDLRTDYMIPFIFNPLPGSELWQRCLEEGYINECYAYEKANHYFQSDLMTGDFTTDDLLRIQGTAYFKNLLRLPLRNPREFVEWYGRQVLRHPDFLRTFFVHLTQSLSLRLHRHRHSPAGLKN